MGTSWVLHETLIRGSSYNLVNRQLNLEVPVFCDNCMSTSLLFQLFLSFAWEIFEV